MSTWRWTYLVGNTHPLHFDRVYSTGLSGKMSGEPIVYGGLVFAWLEGLASRDVSENALWELGFTEGYHTQPAVSGDTVAALSRVVATEAPAEYRF
jgi:2-methylfumaryl-CoA hydratase